MPCERDRRSTAYRVISTCGTSALTRDRPIPTDSVPVTRPRRVDRSLITAPTYSSDTSTDSSSTGSSMCTVVALAASLRASAPAVWKAMSEESTECALPSVSVTLMSTTGYPAATPRSIWVRTPFSTEGMNCRGTAPPTTLSTNSKPPPEGSGSTSMSQTAYCPWPPDCFTCRPWPSALPANVSRSWTRSGTDSTSTPYRLRSRSSRTSRCASPMHHRTSWWVSELFSSFSVGSSATSRPMPWDSLSSSALDFATMATGSSGSGISQGSISSGWSLAERVSPVSALPSLATAQMSPAMHCATVRCVLPSGEVSAPTFSSTSWSSRPRSEPGKELEWPETCTVVSGRMVPENTRTSEMRPTYGSVVVLTTSATSGPAGSHDSGPCGRPSGLVTGGTSCSSGDGNAWVITSRISVVPSPLGAAAASTG